MANKKYEEADIQAIATTIREKTGTDKLYDTSEMASGVDDVYEAGQQAQRKQWWESYLSLDKHWYYMFGSPAWDDEAFDPCVDIVVPQGKFATNMFYMSGITDLEALLKKNNVRLDTSKAYRADSMFKSSKITCLPELDVSNVGRGTVKNINEMFYQCADLHTIRKIIISNVYEVTTGKSTFSGCTSLANIEFGGTIWTDINMSVCPLTVDSMKSIITHLKNYTGITDTSGGSLEMKYTLTLKDTCRIELESVSFTDEDKRLLEENGITVADGTTWISVIGDLKWNLVWATA